MLFYTDFVVWAYQASRPHVGILMESTPGFVTPGSEKVLDTVDPHGKKPCTSWTHMGSYPGSHRSTREAVLNSMDPHVK